MSRRALDWRGLPDAPEIGTELCRADEVPADNGLERRFGHPRTGFSMVLFRQGDGLLAFLNRCPHAGITLNFDEEVFCLYDADGQRDVLCPHHSALFRLPGGVCHDGPCQGDTLTAMPIEVVDGLIRIAADPMSATPTKEIDS